MSIDFHEYDIAANGITHHLIEAGTGPAVLLCHGFPEIAYSWRHQVTGLAAAGYRAVAPDMRGYGGTDAPDDPGAYTLLHIIGDMVALLDALDIETAVVVGHDYGAFIAWNAAMMRPDRFRAVVGISVPYVMRGDASGMAVWRDRPNFYQAYFQEPGVAEADIERDLDAFFRQTFWALSGSPVGVDPWDGDVAEGGMLKTLQEPPGGVIPWLSEDELGVYVTTYGPRGLRGPLNWYRNIESSWELMAPFYEMKVLQPSLHVIGDRDPAYIWGKAAREVQPAAAPGLKDTIVLEGVGHWIQQEVPDRLTGILTDFIRSL